MRAWRRDTLSLSTGRPLPASRPISRPWVGRGVDAFGVIVAALVWTGRVTMGKGSLSDGSGVLLRPGGILLFSTNHQNSAFIVGEVDTIIPIRDNGDRLVIRDERLL